jgi:hypothetical protein
MLCHKRKKQLHFKPNIFLTGTCQLLVTNKGDSSFRSSNHCEVQLLPPKLMTLLFIECSAGRNISEMGRAWVYKEAVEAGLITMSPFV